MDKMKRNRRIKFRVVRSNDQNNRLETRDRDLMIAIRGIIQYSSNKPINFHRSIDRNEAEEKGSDTVREVRPRIKKITI